MLKKLLASVVVLLALSAAPAFAQRAEGWSFFKRGDLAVSPMMLGPMIFTGDASRTIFALMSDFDYHISPNVAIGGLFNLGFAGGFFGLDFGPQFKYKFQIGTTSHVPYLRAGLPFRLGFPSGFDTSFAMGIVQFGGGYKYFFHRMVGAGIDLAFVPTIVLSGGGSFVFGVNIAFGIEVKL